MSQATIFGCSGPELNDAERRFFGDADPWGFILFARNVDAPDRLRRLVDALRESVGRDAPVLIDQEGGRVARLKPPHWRRWRPVGEIVAAPELTDAAKCDALRLQYRIIGLELAALGIDVDCAPLLDVPVPGGHDIIGDRALGQASEAVTARATAVVEGLRAAGVLPVIKHVPGHGRATLDSHEALPVVDVPLELLEATDFAPFRAFAAAPLAMTAHVVFTALDPERCATLSPVVHRYMRETLGLTGLIMSDDLSMRALAGTMAERTGQALDAGCDVVLHCNGDLAEMEAVASATDPLAGAALERADAALSLRGGAEDSEIDALDAEFAALTAPLETAHA